MNRGTSQGIEPGTCRTNVFGAEVVYGLRIHVRFYHSLCVRLVVFAHITLVIYKVTIVRKIFRECALIVNSFHGCEL